MLKNKKGIIMGVANKRSIAWAIAKTLSEAGAHLAFSYQGERLEKNVTSLAESLPQATIAHNCDVSKDEDIDTFFSFVKEKFGGIDFLVHSIAFANKDDLIGNFRDISREGYKMANDISSYSLIATSRAAIKLMPESGGSIVTISFLGGERVIPNYNVMGVAKAALEQSVKYLASDFGASNVRVNAISAGPINTLAARGIPHFNELLNEAKRRCPLQRTTEPEEVADTALFLCSRLARGITGETIHVDSGYHVMGM